MAGQTKPVRRYDADGNQLRTGHTIGSVAHRISSDTEAERQEGLHAIIAESAGRDNDEKDLTAAFKEAEAAFIGGARTPN